MFRPKTGGIILAISAVAGALLALDKLGGNPIAPGFDTGLAWDVRDTCVTLTSDPAGDMTCMVRLWINTQDSLAARLSNGHPLAAVPAIDRVGAAYVDICDTSHVVRALHKFTWPSGVDVVLTTIPAHELSAALFISDWKVFFQDKNDSDSSSRAKWRHQWRLLSLVLLPLSLVGIGVGAYATVSGKKESPLSPLTAEECIVRLIARIDGKPEAEALQLRRLLEKVLLERVTPAATLKQLGMPDLRGQQLWFKAQGQMRDLLDGLVGGLGNYKNLLDVMPSSPPPP